MAKSTAKPKADLTPEDKDTAPTTSQSADEQQALDQLLAFDAETKPPVEFAPATPTSEPGVKKLLFPGDPRELQAHRLDRAPKNSKIVVTDVGAVLATPDGAEVTIADWQVKKESEDGKEQSVTVRGGTFSRGTTGRLPDGDTAHTLPIGSRVLKLGEQQFRATVPGEDGPVEFTGSRVNVLIAEITQHLQGK